MKQFRYLLFLIFAVTFLTSKAQVCTPVNYQFYSKCCDIGIQKLTLGNQTLLDSSNYLANSLYTDSYDSVNTTLNSGITYTLKLKTMSYEQAVCMWVDWNKNDTFESNEIAYSNTFLTPGINNISFTPIACNDSFRVRIMSDYYYDYFTNNATFDPCQVFYGDFLDFKIYTNSNTSIDIAHMGITSTNILNVGYNKVSLNLRNFSNTTIDSARVYYQVNGGSTTREYLNSMGLSSCTDYAYTFNDSFAANNGVYVIKSWVKYPNGQNPDASSKNDTSVQISCVTLSGNYTINQAKATGGTNFNSFSDAALILNTCGINGPVVFTVAPGTYNDSITIKSVSGSSVTNTITFNGVDTSNRIISAFSSNVITLKDCKYMTFKHLAFRMGDYNSNGLYLSGNCEYIDIDSCSFTASQGGNAGVYTNPTTVNNNPYNSNYLTVKNSVFSSISYGLYLVGDFSVKAYGNQVLNNNIKDCGYSVISFYQDTLNIKNNNFTNVAYYGLYLYDIYNSNITKNKVSGNCFSTLLGYYIKDSKITNNFFSSETNTNSSIQISNSQNTQFAHNSSYHSSNTGYNFNLLTSNNFDVRNNIFVTSGSSAYTFYVLSSSMFSNLDFNQYYNGGVSSNYVYIGGDYANITALKGQNGFNNYSSGTKPNFVSTNIPRNLHLVTNLAPIYGDYNVGLTDDIDGDSRCAISPTVGADESKFVSSKPISNFTALDTAFINSPVKFVNQGSFNQGKQFEWFVDTATVPTAISQDLIYTFTSTGTFDVKLKTTNCVQNHDTTKSIVIVTPTKVPVANFSVNTTSIDQLESIKLTDLSTGGTTNWNWTVSGGSNQGVGVDFDYINGTDSTSQNPEIEFYIQGYYSICLTATNSVGSHQVCKSNYIAVYAIASMCVNANTSDMFGHFYDEGGKANPYPYANNKACNLLISPCSGTITITFTKNDFDSNYASLKIYDGTNNSGKLLNKRFIKAGDSFKATSGNMYIDWTSQFGSYAGWEATWTTQYKFIPKAPATIKAKDTAFVSATHSFEAKFYQAGVQYNWDFENDGTIDNSGRNVDYIYTNTGNYQAVCYATSCGGIDTFYKDIIVINPSIAPDPVNFALDATGGFACQVKPQPFYMVEAGVQALLYDKSGNGPTSWEWNVVNTTKSYTWDNGNNIQNPSLTLIDTGYYSIELKVTNNIGTSTKVFNNVINVVFEHCQPNVINTSSDHGFSEFSFNDIYNKSLTSTYYSNYTSTYTSCVEIGTKYGYTLTRGTKSSNCKLGVWIDYNQDGDFSDVGELVKTVSNYSQLSYTDSIKIPALSSMVLFGKTVMRVGIIPSTSNFAVCGNNNQGEYEDYGIFITDDRTPPVITRIGADTVTSEIGLVYIDKGANAFDNLDGVISYTTTNNINTQVQGYYTVTYNAIDKAGNEAAPVNRTVNINGDNSAPVITILGNKPFYHNVKTNYNDAGATAYDSAEGVINITNINSTVNSNALGTYKVTYIASDSKGNTDSATRIVYVVDSLAPVITLSGKDTIYVEVKTGFKEPGYSVVDNNDPNPSITINPINVDSTKIQTVVVTYSATDNKGNQSKVKRWVIFRDTKAPVIKLNGKDTIYVEAKGLYTELGANVADNFDQNPQLLISGGPVNTSILGNYILTYTATDLSGNINSTKRYVIVRKTSKPVIKLVGKDTISLMTAQTYTDQGVTFTDAFYTDAQLRPNLTTGSNFPNPSNNAGTFKTWFHVVDPSGNASDTTIRTIEVKLNGISLPTQQQKIEVYPNPTNGILYISGLPSGKNFIEILDINGKIVYSQLTIESTLELNTANLAVGMYIIRTNNNNQINIVRFDVVK